MDKRLSQYGSRSFERWPESEVADYLKDCNITGARKMQDGQWIGLNKLLYTLSVCVGISPIESYKYRWCFEDPQEALFFHSHAEKLTDIPIKRQSLVGHRYMAAAPLLVERDELGLPKW